MPLGSDAEAQGMHDGPLLHDLVQTHERAAADEQDVRGVDAKHLLVGMLAAPLGRHGGDRSLHDLQERLLHPLPRNVTRNGGVVPAFARDLVDLIYIDDAALRGGDVVPGVLDELEEDVLHVFPT